MDFTNNPAANMFPDESLFLFLQDLYGTIPPGRRNLGQHMPQYFTTSSVIPWQIRQRMEDIVLALENHEYSNERFGGSETHQSERRDAYKSSLGDGWVLQVHIELVDEK